MDLEEKKMKTIMLMCMVNNYNEWELGATLGFLCKDLSIYLTCKYVFRKKLYWVDDVYGLCMLNIVYVEIIENALFFLSRYGSKIDINDGNAIIL